MAPPAMALLDRARVGYPNGPAGVSSAGIWEGKVAVPTCPHCRVGMWEYERVQKADGPYGRFECRTQWCPTCKGRCTEKIGQSVK
jgi:hypothetical protein